ncbi:S8 family serine peptidase [Dyella sp.]|uniref:S8 family serine peptidase n=1 Tax=Dyella sp. TaxID=1869338 RepID=UPI002B471B62|nr:S8 family serine peptidase [Dyella sp.]HKT27517.1 S8 family serine peptidase [Dyella sp.]
MKSFFNRRHTVLMAAMLLILPAAYATNRQQTAASKISAVSNQETDTYDRFIISYREGSGIRNNPAEVAKDVQFAITTSGVGSMVSARSGARGSPLTATYKRKLGVGAELVQTSRKLDPAEANALMQKIAMNPDVVYVEPDRKLRIEVAAVPDSHPPRAEVGSKASSTVPLKFDPNDPDYDPFQWNFYAPGSSSANINNGWNLANGTNVTIAVIDSGMAPNPDSNDTWVCDGYNFSSDDAAYGEKCAWDPGHPPGNPIGPSTWHGTKVAGVINAKTNNGIGLAGVAYNARLVPLRTVPYDGAYVSDVANSIEWASGGHVEGFEDAAYPAQVINMSFGNLLPVGQTCADNYPTLVRAVQDAVARNVVLVASAGNNNANNATHIPSSCPGVIAVGATDFFGARAWYSNYGEAVALAAPAGGARPDSTGNYPTCAKNQEWWGCSWMLSNSGTYAPSPDESPYIAVDVGTSFAAPLVTGTVALMISARQNVGLPAATPAQIRDWLTSSARHFPSTPDQPIGSGILDAHAAVVKAIEN